MTNFKQDHMKNHLLQEYINKHPYKKLSIFNEDTDVFLIIDVAGNFVYGSQCFQTFIGYSDDQLGEVQSIHEIFPYINMELLISEEMESFPGQLINRDGKQAVEATIITFPIFSGKQFIGKYIVFKEKQLKDLDMTERHQYETNVKSVMENFSDAVVMMNQDKIIHYNQKALGVMGKNEGREVLGKSIFEFIHPNDKEALKKDMKKLSLGYVSGLKKHRFIRENGEVVLIETQGLPSFYRKKEIFYFLIRNVDEKNINSQLARLVEKLSAVGQIAAGFAHELNHPLTLIKGFIELIKQGYEEEEYLEVIVSEIEKIEMLLQEFIVLGDPQQKKQGQHNILLLLKQITTLLEE